MIAGYDTQNVTPGESMRHDWEVDMFNRQSEHAVRVKELELALTKADHEAEVELKKLQAKWQTWLQIPIVIIKLPVFILLAIAYIFCVFTGYQPPKRFWDLLS